MPRVSLAVGAPLLFSLGLGPPAPTITLLISLTGGQGGLQFLNFRYLGLDGIQQFGVGLGQRGVGIH